VAGVVGLGLVLSFLLLVGQNPDLGVLPPRPPVGGSTLPQTPSKGLICINHVGFDGNSKRGAWSRDMLTSEVRLIDG
jgi:hypothetical protein